MTRAAPSSGRTSLPTDAAGGAALAECSDWRKGTIDQRRGTVRLIREFAGGPVGSSQGIQRGRMLDDAQAYRLLDRSCSKGYARGFRLYILYTRRGGIRRAPGTRAPSARAPASKNPSGY